MRKPWNVFIYLYRKAERGYEFLLLKRRDDGIWQGAAGGGEDNETPIEAARREAHEETGTPDTLNLIKLDTMSYMEKTLFSTHKIWSDNIYVIPMYYFASEYEGDIVISGEHSEYRWFNYYEAQKKLFWHDNKTALWELNERLSGLT